MTTTVLTIGLKGSVVLGVALGVAALLRRAPASARHVLWTLTLAAIAVLPVLNGIAPRWELPVGVAPAPQVASTVDRVSPRPWGSTGIARAVTTAAPDRSGGALHEAEVAASRGARPAAVVSPSVQRVVSPLPATGEPAVAAPAVRSGAGDAEASAATTGRGWSPGVLMLVLWAAGFGALAVASVRGRSAARRLADDSLPVGPAVVARAERWARALGIRRPVRVRVHPRLEVPVAWGAVRPVVLLPRRHALWSPAMLDHVLIHELAHVRRGDCASQWLGELARALHWPNPLVWVAARMQRIEAERASDDLVLGTGVRPSSYARDLVRIARGLRARAAVPSAAVAMAGGGPLVRRVESILDPLRSRSSVGRTAFAACGLTVVALAVSVAGATPVARAQAADPAPERAEVASARPEAAAERPDAAAATDFAGRAPERLGTSMPELGSSAPEPARGVALGVDDAPVGASTQVQEWCPAREGGRNSTSSQVDDDRVRIRWETDDCRLEVDIRGEVEFAADDSGIDRMERGALFELEERVPGERRRVRLRGEGGQDISVEYWVDGRETPWGPEADAWMARILPELFRRTTLNAENRVRRFLAEGGPSRVLAEIEAMESDHVARTYMDHLVELVDLTVDQTAELLYVAARGLDSDHHLADVLIGVVEDEGFDQAYQEPLLRGAERLDSDHHRRRVLEALMDSPDLSQTEFDAIVRVAADIDSDHHLAEILVRVVRNGMLSGRGRAAFVEALGSLDSDHQHRQVLEAFLDRGDLSDAELTAVLTMTRGLDSDHHRAAVLQAVAGSFDLSGPQVTAYLESAGEIDSDHQLRETALAIVERASFDTEQLGLVLRMADGVGSSHHRSGILEGVIRRRALSSEEVRELVAITEDIDSDHNASETLRLLVGEQSLDDAGLVAVLERAGRIGSDHNSSRLLLEVAERYELDGAPREAYRAAADGLDSRHLRNEALAAIVR